MFLFATAARSANISACQEGEFVTLGLNYTVINFTSHPEQHCFYISSCFFFSKGKFTVDVETPSVDEATKEVKYTHFKEEESPLGFYNNDAKNKAKIAIAAANNTILYLVPTGVSDSNVKYYFTTSKNFKKDYKIDLKANPGKYTIMQYFNTQNASVDVKNSGNANLKVSMNNEVKYTLSARDHDDYILSGLVTVEPDTSVKEKSEIDISIKGAKPDFISDVDMEMSGSTRFLEHKGEHKINNARDAIIGCSCCLAIILFYIALYFCCCRNEAKAKNGKYEEVHATA